jgi:hypothetical protein
MAAGAPGEPIGVGEKDPDAVKNYTIDWSDWLNGLSIGGSTWARATGSTGITISTGSNNTTTATIVVSGGTSGQTYKVINRITTSTSTGGPSLRDERTIHINVIER